MYNEAQNIPHSSKPKILDEANIVNFLLQIVIIVMLQNLFFPDKISSPWM